MPTQAQSAERMTDAPLGGPCCSTGGSARRFAIVRGARDADAPSAGRWSPSGERNDSTTIPPSPYGGRRRRAMVRASRLDRRGRARARRRDCGHRYALPVAQQDARRPDGQFVVYDAPQQRSAAGRRVFIVRAGGSEDRRLVEGSANDASLVWTPDGRRVLFASDRSGTMDVWSVDVDRGAAQGAPQLVHRSVGRMWLRGLTDAGSYFYYATVGAVDVYQAELTNAGAKNPATLPATYVGSNISSIFSPDGRRLAYASRRGLIGFDRGSTTLAIRDLGTNQPRELVPALNGFLLSSLTRPIATGANLTYFAAAQGVRSHEIRAGLEYEHARLSSFSGLTGGRAFYDDDSQPAILGTKDDGAPVTVFYGQDSSRSAPLLTNPKGAYRRYHGVQLIGSKRYAKATEFQASYTWSRVVWLTERS